VSNYKKEIAAACLTSFPSEGKKKAGNRTRTDDLLITNSLIEGKQNLGYLSDTLF